MPKITINEQTKDISQELYEYLLNTDSPELRWWNGLVLRNQKDKEHQRLLLIPQQTGRCFLVQVLTSEDDILW